ncbi:hypothetical protein [Microbispora bryophytorum]|uniref:hypothetical protein n=1 Tax=Microbispora bryophytorum TaxID=1460882 RepID=UPI0034007BCD
MRDRSLLEPLAAACAWTAEHWDELLDARESYDQAARLDPGPSPRTGATASRTPESPAA